MKSYSNIVVLTGAGISAESGIRTFRAADGLWEDHRVEDVATPEGFRANPALVHDFYNQRRAQLMQAEIRPNAAHIALAEFERLHQGSFLLVTQNVDNLHERAGSQNLLHMHGELMKSRCQFCGDVATLAQDHYRLDTACSCTHCHSKGSLRPHIVWFGEMPFEMERIYQALAECDLFVSIGTSGNVYPAAGFHAEASRCGATCVELNLEPSSNAHGFDEGLYGPATTVVPAFFNKLT